MKLLSLLCNKLSHKTFANPILQFAHSLQQTDIEDVGNLVHRFLTGVHEDHKNKEMYPFTPILQWFRGSQVVVIDTLGVRGTFLTLRGPQSRKG